MATSGSADFSVSGSEIVSAAYRIVYNTSSEYTLEAVELADGLQALNMLVKNLMGPPNFLAKGIKTWQRKTASLTLTAKIEFSLKSSGGDLNIDIPAKVLHANYKIASNDNETPLREMTYQQYFQIADKTATGTPNRYNYQRELDAGKFRLNVVPTAAIVSAGNTIEIAYLTPLEDFDAGANDPYFPQEWYRPLKWLLAQEMHPESGRAMPAEVAALASQSVESANTFEAEKSDIFFEPNNPENW
jgi:hypothetical protein